MTDKARVELERLRALLPRLLSSQRRASAEARQADGDFWQLSKCLEEAKGRICELEAALDRIRKESSDNLAAAIAADALEESTMELSADAEETKS